MVTPHRHVLHEVLGVSPRCLGKWESCEPTQRALQLAASSVVRTLCVLRTNAGTSHSLEKFAVSGGILLHRRNKRRCWIPDRKCIALCGHMCDKNETPRSSTQSANRHAFCWYNGKQARNSPGGAERQVRTQRGQRNET